MCQPTWMGSTCTPYTPYIKSFHTANHTAIQQKSCCMLLYGGHTAARTSGFGCCMIQHTATFSIQQLYSRGMASAAVCCMGIQHTAAYSSIQQKMRVQERGQKYSNTAVFPYSIQQKNCCMLLYGGHTADDSIQQIPYDLRSNQPLPWRL